MAAPNLRAIRDWVNNKVDTLNKTLGKNITDVSNEVDNVKDSLTLKGGQVYLDEQDGQYGFNTSPERGADTFTPFKSGGSSGGGGGLSSPIQYKIKTDTSNGGSETRNVNLQFYIPTDLNYTKFVANGTISLQRSSSTGKYISLNVGCNFDNDVIGKVSAGSNVTTLQTKKIENVEVDLSGKDLQYFYIYCNNGTSGTSYSFTYSIDLTIDLYF